jgi:hypothetical protein
MGNLNDLYGNDAPKPEQPKGGDGLVPEGWRHLTIERAEIATNDRGWAAIKIGCKDRETGLWAWEMFTLKHATSARAVEIGRQRYGELCWACGFERPPGDTADLERQEFGGKIKHKPDDYSGGKREAIVAVRKPHDMPAASSGAMDAAGDIPF